MPRTKRLGLRIETYLSLNFIPSVPEALDTGRPKGNGNIEGTVEVVVLIAVVGNLDEVLYDYCTLGWGLAKKNLCGHPGCHLWSTM